MSPGLLDFKASGFFYPDIHYPGCHQGYWTLKPPAFFNPHIHHYLVCYLCHGTSKLMPEASKSNSHGYTHGNGT